MASSEELDRLDETTKPVIEQLGILEEIKDILEFVNKNREDSERIANTYRTQIVPRLIKIRSLNRASKDNLEFKYANLDKINQRVMSLNDHHENLTFEAAYVENEVASARSSATEQQLTDEDKLDKLTHEERLKAIEAEGIRREHLRKKLSDLTIETDRIENLCHSSEKEIIRLKPYVKQLIDKLDIKM